MAYYNPLTLRYEQGEPISRNQSPSATDAFVFTPPGMTTGMGMPGTWGNNPIGTSHNPWQSDFTPAPGGSGSWEDAAMSRPAFAPGPQYHPGDYVSPTTAPNYSGPSFAAALLPDSPGNIWAAQNARLNGPGQASDFMSQGSQPAGRPGQVWDPVTQSYRGANEPPPGAVRTNNPNVWVLPNGSTWNTPGYTNDVNTDQGYDQWRQQTFGVGNPTGAGIYQNTQGAGAGPTNLGGPGIPYQAGASPAQQALMIAPPPATRPNSGYQGPAGVPGFVSNSGPQQVTGQYNGGGYPLTPGMPGYQYSGQQGGQQGGGQNDLISFLMNALGLGAPSGGGASANPYGPYSVGIGSYYGNQGQGQGQQYSSNINAANMPGGSQYVPTSAWDNFAAAGGWSNGASDKGRGMGWTDTAATLNPGQAPATATPNSATSTSGGDTSTDPWAGVTGRAADWNNSGSLWR